MDASVVEQTHDMPAGCVRVRSELSENSMAEQLKACTIVTTLDHLKPDDSFLRDSSCDAEAVVYLFDLLSATIEVLCSIQNLQVTFSLHSAG